MTFLQSTIRVELAILVASFVVLIAWKIVRGALRPESRAAFRRACGSGMASVIRLQVLAASLVFALWYLAAALQSVGRASLPPVPGYALALLSGSQAVFVSAAAWRVLRPSVDLRNEGEK